MPGDGSLITQLGHVSDLTDVMIRCINFENSKNNIYNCSGEKGVTIKGLIYFCAEVLGLNQNEISLRKFDFQKLDPKILKLYETFITKNRTNGISKLENRISTCCKIELPNAFIEKIKKSEIPIICNCGKSLISE